MSQTAAPSGQLVVVGANHRSGSMSFRDRLFVEDAALSAFFEPLRASLDEVMVVCTGERVDVYGFGADEASAIDAIIQALASNAALTIDDVRAQVYALSGDGAVRHVFRTAASLDSLMVGDAHIRDQLTNALVASGDAGFGGAQLTALLATAAIAAQAAFDATELGGAPVSISSAALEVARDLHGDLASRVGLLIGGGDTSEVIVEDLIAGGLGRTLVSHPTSARAQATARGLGGHTVAIDSIAEALADADVVLSALSQTAVTITADMVKAAIKKRRYKPIFIIDAGIPGDVDPAVDRLDEAFVYTLDDLERVAMATRTDKKGDVAEAERMVDAQAVAYSAGGDVAAQLEAARVDVLNQAGGNAETATRLLLDKVKSLLRKT